MTFIMPSLKYLNLNFIDMYKCIKIANWTTNSLGSRAGK